MEDICGSMLFEGCVFPHSPFAIWVCFVFLTMIYGSDISLLFMRLDICCLYILRAYIASIFLWVHYSFICDFYFWELVPFWLIVLCVCILFNCFAFLKNLLWRLCLLHFPSSHVPRIWCLLCDWFGLIILGYLIGKYVDFDSNSLYGVNYIYTANYARPHRPYYVCILTSYMYYAPFSLVFRTLMWKLWN